jgi:cobyrinic acid a,c-diamide synthase
LPERHLGLVQAGELSAIEDFIDNAAKFVARECDFDLLENCFEPMKLTSNTQAGLVVTTVKPPGQNIAIARDQAFSFIYPHLLHDWRNNGAQISFFSPLANEGPDELADAVYLPGGYPELHGQKLAAADRFAAAMAGASNRGALIYGECGGYMVLGKGLIDGDGMRHRMLGLLPLETSFENRKLHLGYRKLTARSEFFAGNIINAHEFHYTSIINQKGEPLFEARDALGVRLGKQGLRDKNVMGSYMHLIDTGFTYPDTNGIRDANSSGNGNG